MNATRTSRSERAVHSPAVTGRKTGAERSAPIPRARLAAIFSPLHIPRIRFLDRLAAELKASEKTRAGRLAAGAELSALVSTLKERAASERWSARELAQRLGLSWGTWFRIRRSEIDPVEWLPKVRAAATRLQQTSQETQP